MEGGVVVEGKSKLGDESERGWGCRWLLLC